MSKRQQPAGELKQGSWRYSCWPEGGEQDEEKQKLVEHGKGEHASKVEDPIEQATPISAYSQEARRLLGMAVPLGAQNVLFMTLAIVNTAFVGRLGAHYLAAAVLATSLYNITGYSMMTGLACGLETLCGQAYGAGDYQQVGVMLQRGLAVNLLAASGVMVLWSRLEGLLIMMGQDPNIARMAANYLYLCIPALLCHAVDTCVVRYLVVQGVTKPNMVSTGIGTALAPAYLYYFVYKRGWGLEGAAVAYVCAVATIAACNASIVCMRVMVLLRGKPEACWPGWSRSALRGWRTYLEYAVPSWAMISLEWVAFETLLVLSGLLPNPELAVATYGIAINIASLAYTVPMALLDACITRVSNSLGAQHPLAARTAARTSAMLVFATQCTMCLVVLAMRSHIGKVWTDSSDIIDSVSAAALPLSLAVIGDGCCCVLAAALRASGRQVLGLTLNFCTFWVFGLPFSAFLAFGLKLGVPGLWGGLGIVTSIQAVALLSIQLQTDWQQLSVEAAHRVKSLRHGGDSPVA